MSEPIWKSGHTSFLRALVCDAETINDSDWVHDRYDDDDRKGNVPPEKAMNCTNSFAASVDSYRAGNRNRSRRDDYDERELLEPEA